MLRFNRFLFSILLLLFFDVSSPNAASWYSDHEKGWFWYRSEVRDQKEEGRKKNTEGTDISEITGRLQKDTIPSTDKVFPMQQKIKHIQQEFEEATSKAILVPTLTNVQKVMTLQRQILDRSTRFQEMWMQASLLEGQHVRAEDNPAPGHRKILREEQEKDLSQKIKRVARETGLFFLFKKSCPYCYGFAPVVKEFAETHGFEVKAISQGGEKLEEFPNAVADNGISLRLNPQGIYPALFLAHPASNTLIPLAWGMVSPDQLLENMRIVLKQISDSRNQKSERGAGIHE